MFVKSVSPRRTASVRRRRGERCEGVHPLAWEGKQFVGADLQSCSPQRAKFNHAGIGDHALLQQARRDAGNER
jgi:hypothetical protein